MSLTKKDIADIVMKELQINHAHGLSITDDFFELLQQTLATGEAVKLSGFGNLVVSDKAARPGRNPKTGEAVEICARKVVTFKAGPKLKIATKQGES